MLDTRVWRRNDVSEGSIRIDCPQIFDADRRFRLELSRKGALKFNTVVRGVRGSRTIELPLVKDDEKKFQTGNSNEPFKLELIEETSSDVIYTGSFYRLKSTKSKLFESLTSCASSASTSLTKPASDINRMFKSKNGLLDQSVGLSSSTYLDHSDCSTVSSMKPSICPFGFDNGKYMYKIHFSF